MKYLFLFILCFVQLAWAQSGLPEQTDNVLVNRQLLYAQMKENVQDELEGEFTGTGRKKSIGKAVIMSAVLPGAGQLYAGSYWKSALFLAAEAAAWGVNISYNNKGDDQTDKFEQFAQDNWSEQRYWTFVYLNLYDNPSVPEDVRDNLFDIYGDPGNFATDPKTGHPVISNWDNARHDMEKYTRYLSGFSHELPETPTQQYYEMIGKYPEQFGNAWADASYEARYQGGYGDANRENVTVMNKNYVLMRQKANDFYDKAAYGTMIALLNHVIAAIDAGFAARGYNNRQMRVTYDSRRLNGEYVNMFGLAMRF